MSTTTETTPLQAAIAEHAAARSALDDATRRRDEAIRKAVADGTSVADVARLVGVNRARVYQVLGQH